MVEAAVAADGSVTVEDLDVFDLQVLSMTTERDNPGVIYSLTPKQPLHKAPELIYCLQRFGCGFKKDGFDSDITPVRCTEPESYQMHENGPFLDRIEAMDANGTPMVWLGHWNDGVEPNTEEV